MVTVPAIRLGQSIFRMLVETATELNESVCVLLKFLHTIPDNTSFLMFPGPFIFIYSNK
jgi:hypothetical protein